MTSVSRVLEEHVYPCDACGQTFALTFRRGHLGEVAGSTVARDVSVRCPLQGCRRIQSVLLPIDATDVTTHDGLYAGAEVLSALGVSSSVAGQQGGDGQDLAIWPCTPRSKKGDAATNRMNDETPSRFFRLRTR